MVLNLPLNSQLNERNDVIFYGSITISVVSALTADSQLATSNLNLNFCYKEYVPWYQVQYVPWYCDYSDFQNEKMCGFCNLMHVSGSLLTKRVKSK